MSLALDIRAFRRSPARRRCLALEAAAELLRARLMTLLPARVYARDFGSLDAAPVRGGSAATEIAMEIGRMVECVASAMPFRAVCLQQALAARRMLRRRGLGPTVCLGLQRRDSAAGPGYAAHAWVEVGAQIVTGGAGRADCAVVARFG